MNRELLLLHSALAAAAVVCKYVQNRRTLEATDQTGEGGEQLAAAEPRATSRHARSAARLSPGRSVCRGLGRHAQHTYVIKVVPVQYL